MNPVPTETLKKFLNQDFDWGGLTRNEQMAVVAEVLKYRRLFDWGGLTRNEQMAVVAEVLKYRRLIEEVK